MTSESTKALNCYKIDCLKNLANFNAAECINSNIGNLEYPALILIRDNGWNDYGFHSHFRVFYLQETTKIIDLGSVRIIQSIEKGPDTLLPDKFECLNPREFFSSGTDTFYIILKTLGELRDVILLTLNDIHYKNYSSQYMLDFDNGNFYHPYLVSLLRNDFELEVSSEYKKNALEMLDKINACLDSISSFDSKNQKVMGRLLFGATITALESYLGDAFKYNVINNPNYYVSFLKNYEFNKDESKKYSLQELGLHGDNIGAFIKSKTKEVMDNIIFHKIELVISLYKSILNIDLPNSLVSFKPLIQKRHDIFHRNGKDISGSELEIQSDEIKQLISQVKNFITNTDRLLLVKI